MPTLNYWAILGAAVVNIVAGSIWFGPLFGKVWMDASGMTMEQVEAMKKKGMSKRYLLMFIGAFVMAYVMANTLIYVNAYLATSGALSGVMVGFYNWLGFVAPVSIGAVLWDNKSWKYWWITFGFHLVAMALMGIVLAVWR